MKIVIAPDTFKECLPAAKVAQALAEGALDACGDAQVDLCPMADGGEGTVEAMVAATGGRILAADVFDPLGGPVRGHFGLLGAAVPAALPGELGLAAAAGQAQGTGRPARRDGGAVAVVEMAAASGLALIEPERRDPLRATTYGTGQLITAALDAGARQVLVGIGGSATVDGGCGCAQALGVAFTDGDGQPCVCGLAGGGLKDIAHIDLSGRDRRLADARIRVACDVQNPLLGPAGAAAVYGPQKGATAEVVEQLEAGLANLAETIRRDLGVDVAELAGAGAAGGLGAGLVAFADATLESGLELVAEAVRLRRRLGGADLCLTGEGRLDAQSACGKTAVGVARIARERDVPTVCLPGCATPDAPVEEFAAVVPLSGRGVSPRAAIRQAPNLLRDRARQVVRWFLDRRGRVP